MKVFSYSRMDIYLLTFFFLLYIGMILVNDDKEKKKLCGLLVTYTFVYRHLCMQETDRFSRSLSRFSLFFFAFSLDIY